jgi:hypothetical protein
VCQQYSWVVNRDIHSEYTINSLVYTFEQKSKQLTNAMSRDAPEHAMDIQLLIHIQYITNTDATADLACLDTVVKN